MKNIISILICAILALLITFASSFIFDKNGSLLAIEYTNDKTLIKQEIIEYTNEPNTYYKLYISQDFIGIITNLDYVKTLINELYLDEYESTFPNTSMSFGEDVYLDEEITYYKVENVDDEIFAYLKKHNGIGIYTNVVDFSTNDGIYASIYVRDIEDFNQARDAFLENFISSEELYNLTNNKRPTELTEVGSQSIGFRVQETITSSKGIVNPKKIMTSKDQILEYLRYGDNKERIYHTVEEGETLTGVGYHYYDMTPTQIMMLNPDKITSTDQILEVGMVLNVTYFTSPITVIITKERLAIEEVYPIAPLYVEDATLYTNATEVIQEEKPGSEYTLYEETWVNGVLFKGIQKSTSPIVSPIQGVIKVGTKQKPSIGTGSFRWPIENVHITNGWWGYYGHEAIDLQNMYNRYDKVYASDNGVIIENSYDGISGNYVVIDHNNGFQTYYGHMSSPSEFKIGDVVMKGDVLGNIGTTGYTTGPHVHFEIRVDGVKHNPCEFMNCKAVVGG